MSGLFLRFSVFVFVIHLFLFAELVSDRILSVSASIDTIGEILLKIIPTLEEVRCYLSVVCKYTVVSF